MTPTVLVKNFYNQKSSPKAFFTKKIGMVELTKKPSCDERGLPGRAWSRGVRRIPPPPPASTAHSSPEFQHSTYMRPKI